MKKNIILIILSLGCWVGIHAQTPQKMTYVYDALNRLTEVTYPNGSKITYNYDVLGNRTSVVTVGSCTLPTATLTGTQTITAGQTANLSVALTGVAPWSIVMNGTTYTASVSPFSISVNPNITTTYALTNVSNSCGVGTVSGSAVVTVNTACVLPVATLTGTQTITAGQTANLSVALTGVAPWSIVMNGTTYTANASPFSISVNPSITTTYTLTSVSNSCGAGTVSGSAVVTVVVDGLLAHYKFDGNFIDLSGNNNTAIPRNGVAFGGDVKGASGNSICLDGINDYLDTPFEQKNIVKQTVSFWVKIDQANLPIGRSTLIQARGLGGAGGIGTILGYQKYSNSMNNNNVWFYQLSFDGGLVGIQFPYENNNTWVHIVGVWSGTSGSPITSTQFSLYLNGIKQTNIVNWNVGSPIAPVNGIGTTRIGFWDGDGSTGYFKGCIDNLRYYHNQALTLNEINTIYLQEQPCSNMQTTKSGNWNDITVWSCGRVPTSTDIITVKANHFITIPASYTANAKNVVFETGGKIIEGANTSKLCLKCP